MTLLRKSSCFKAGILLHSVLVLLLQRELGKEYGLCAHAISKSTALQERFKCCCHPKENQNKVQDIAKSCTKLLVLLMFALDVLSSKLKSKLSASGSLSLCFILWCFLVWVFRSSCPNVLEHYQLTVQQFAVSSRWR